jgi:argininosuccinate lyase
VKKLSKLLRGGRIDSARKDVVKFTASIKDDEKILESVIKINQAHVIMLIEQEIIDEKTGSKLLAALIELSPKIKLSRKLEDAHLAVEEKVNNKVGSEVGGNLHIAKSRNDQVATAIRMRLRTEILEIINIIVTLQNSLIEMGMKHTQTLVPSYTHLHPAQPVTFGHILVSYVDALERSLKRLEETFPRINLCPMGAGAIATTSFPINRKRTAKLLGFDGIVENSIDAIGSRDFVLETLANLTLLAINISKITEDFILWSAPDFGIIDLPDNFAFTSSIMPQKKNPDILEVIRARMSHILGNFVTSATIMKSLPSGYNLDFQELTPKLWESIDIISTSMFMLSELVKHLNLNKNIFAKKILNYSTTTELANLLVVKYNVPFRESHKIIGAVVKILLDNNLELSDLKPELIKKIAKEYTGINLVIKIEDIKEHISPKKFVESHKTTGGPAPTEVERMLKYREELIKKSKTNLKEKKLRLNEAELLMKSEVQRYIQFQKK